jgi:lipoate-protein ligase B
LAPRLAILRPGTLDYASAYDLQQRAATRLRGGGDASLILLQHPPTYTLGARANRANLIMSEERLRARGAEVVVTDRGGDVTFHGPGQLVAYPILDLRALGLGVSDYVWGLEQVIIRTLARFGLPGDRSDRGRGVWVEDAKIAAIGVRVSRGVTAHGLALNVNNDLTWFDAIIPCGLQGVRVTSMRQFRGRPVDARAVEDALIAEFAEHFLMTVEETRPAEVAV